MPRTITDVDIERQVTEVVDAGESDGIDVDGVVSEIIATYGLVHIDEVPSDDFWAIIERHDKSA